MSVCTACGHGPVTGKFCPACGQTAAPVPPPPAPPVPAPGSAALPTSPPPARFPLYAEDRPPAAPPPPAARPTDDSTAERPAVGATPAASDPGLPPPGSHAGPRSGPGAAVWLIGIAVVLLFAVVGGALLFFGGAGDDPDRAADPATTAPAESAQPTEADGGENTESTENDDDDGADPAPESTSALVPADVEVPGSASDSRDNSGAVVTFGPDNLFDDDPTTSWRVSGDASGDALVLSFDKEVTLTEVGLINGYAKNDPPNDWYLANRRVLEVEWTFADGTTVSQSFEDGDRAVQMTEIEPTLTSSVELRIVAVTSPGGRDYTAISEVALVGAAG